MNQFEENKSEFEKLWQKGEFNIPKGYFDQLPLQISERLSSQRSHSRIAFPQWRKPVFVSVIFLLAIAFLLKPNISNDDSVYPETDLFSELNRSEVIQYLSEAELETYMLTENNEQITINEDLIFYDQDLSEEELLNNIDWNDPTINI